jgi:hypothetical protein
MDNDSIVCPVCGRQAIIYEGGAIGTWTKDTPDAIISVSTALSDVKTSNEGLEFLENLTT